jgi:NADH dehydrogenase/NADH:ubiquinone oxidoreductase subunit G
LQKKNFEFVGVLGSVSSVEESYFFLQFLKNFGNANLIIQKTLYNINQDLPNFYLFNSSLSSVDNSDLILLVGVNPRTEGSMLNIRLRKQFFNKEILIGYIGSVVEFTFPTTHLGNSSKILLEIAEGKHFFCQKLRKAKKPLIIFGSEIGFRQDSQTLQNLL